MKHQIRFLCIVLCMLFALTACGALAENQPSEPMPPEGVGGTVPSAVAAFDLASATNGSAPTVTLNSGYQMPINGIGTYSLHDEVCISAITAALHSGVRLIDTAHAYGNEKEVGEAIRSSDVPREDIFVITKLYPDQFSDPEAAIAKHWKS